MTDILLIALAMSLLYISIANRLYTYLNILVFQGFILFGVTYLTLTIILSSSIKDPNLDKTFFVVALSTIFTGLYLIVTRKKIITHVIGYIIIENGVFVLSLAVGNEMPMLVNLGIMLDIFASVLILGVFFNRIGDLLKNPDIDHLRNLKD